MTGKTKAMVTFLLTFLFSVTLTAQSLDWPTFRHDQGRTGRAAGHGDIANPAVHWSYNVGGSLGSDQIWVGDANGDGTNEFGIVEAGHVFLRNASDQVIWHTGPIGASQIVGLFDLDKDDHDEFLITAVGPSAALMLVDSVTGDVLWRFSDFASGAAALRSYQVAVADLNGDGYLDLVTSPGANCRIAHAFSFASGINPDPHDNLLWTYTHKVYSQKTPYLVGDVDDDGTMEVVFLEYRQLTILNGEDGSPQAEFGQIFQYYSFGLIQIAQTDQDPQLEVIAIGGTHYNYAVTVFDAVDETVTWQFQWYPTDGKNLVLTENSVADLDGDGTLEIAVSVFNDVDDEYTTNASEPGDHDGVNRPDHWTLIVFDAATGYVEATLEDAYLQGIEFLGDDIVPDILVQRVPSGSPAVPRMGQVQAFRLENQVLVEKWSMDSASVSLMQTQTQASLNISTWINRVAAFDIDGDSKKELLITKDIDENDEADIFLAINTDHPTPSIASELVLDDWESVRVVSIGNGLSAPDKTAEIALFSNNGFLEVFGPDLAIRSSLRVGGYARSPIAVDLDNDGVKEVVTATSHDEVQVLDVSNANTFTPPVKTWGFQGAIEPILTARDMTGNGRHNVAVRTKIDNLNPAVALLDPAGEMLLESVFPGYGKAPSQIVFGTLNNDEILDYIVLIQDITQPHDVDIRIIALDGSDGSELWNRPSDQNNSPRQEAFLEDVNDDGIDDPILVDSHQIEYYDGADGSLIKSVPYTNWRWETVLADFDTDGLNELLIKSRPEDEGLLLYELLSDNPTWNIPNAYPAELNGRSLGIFGHSEGLGILKSTAEGTLQAFGPDGAPLWADPVYLRGGEVLHGNPGDDNNLKAVTVADVDNDGVEDAIVGTADGYLMTLRIADGSLIWSLPMRSMVDEPIVADVDADGLNEILVSTGDGYLHMIDQASQESPTVVRDVALSYELMPENPNIDVDTTERREALAASWDPVPGAIGYRYSIIDDENVEIIPWVDVDNVTLTVADTAPLQLGKVYRFVIQVYGENNAISVESQSDGIEVVDRTAPWMTDFSVTPNLITKTSDEVEIRAKAFDQTWLDRYQIEIIDSEQEVVWSYEEPLFSNEADIVVHWDGTDSLQQQVANGNYEVKLTVYDMVGHETSDSEMVKVLIESGDDPGDPSCGCRRTGAQGGLFSWLFSILS